MGTPSTARRNRATVLAAVRAVGEATRAELAEATGLSLATVARAVSSLTESGVLVEQTEPAHGSRGRPLGRVRVQADIAHVAAVDIADHHTTLAHIALDGRVLWRECISDVPAEPEARVAHTLAAVDLAWSASTRSRLPIALGVAVPGPVDAQGTVAIAPALGWQEVPLGTLLGARTEAPVAVGNDANLIAIAEHRWGELRNAVSLFTLAVFEGVGAGVVEDGRIIEGSRGFAGQFGRMLVSPDSIERMYDGFGDLESQLGATGLVRRAREAGISIPAGREPFEAVFSQLDDGTAGASLAHQMLDEFAVALANVCALLDPEAIILAGRFAPLADRVVPQLRRRLQGRVLHMPRLLPASMGADGVFLGAAAIALDAFGPLDQLLS